MSNPSKDPRSDLADHGLHRVLRPASVAVVGASSDPTKRGHQVLVALEEAGYAGEVFPVNPRGGAIRGLPVHASLEELPGTPDLALVCTPAATAPEVVAACGRKGVAGAVILAVGFREAGPEGMDLEARTLAAARAGGVRLVGPNTSGILNLPMGLNLIGARGVRPGSLSLLVQSGNMALALMNEVTRRSADGIALAIGVGNQADLGFAEYLDFLGDDDATRAVVVYVEAFHDGRAFLEVAARVSSTTPVLVVKGGRSGAGKEAARSHTGAVAGEYERLQAGFRQAGIVEVVRTDELLHLAEMLAHQPPVEAGRGVAILSDGGGQGTLAADRFEEAGVLLARPGAATRDGLRALLGSAAAVGNPVDLAGAADADPEVFQRALAILADDPEVGGVVLVGLFGGYGLRFSEELAPGERAAAEAMADLMRDVSKPLVVHSMYAGAASPSLDRLREARVPVVESLEVACRCLEEAWRRGRRPDGPAPSWPPPREDPPSGLVVTATERVEALRTEGRTTLTEPEARELLAAAGATLPPAVLCLDEEAVRHAVTQRTGPLALKVVSSRIPHKTEAGGVALGVEGPEAAVEAYRRITGAARAFLGEGGDPVDGVLVSSMMPPPLAELLVGASRDPDLGPVLTVGAGGIWVEILADVTHRVLPVTPADIETMLDELRIRPLLEGARGRPPAARERIVDEIQAVARCLLAHPALAEVEINPLFVYPDGARAVDARIFLEEEA